MQAITEYHLNFTYPVLPETDIDAALYQRGFMSDLIKHIAAEFHAANFAEKSGIAQKFSSDWRDLAERILWRQAGSIPRSSPFYSKSARMVDYRGQEKLTIPAALTEVQVLLQEADAGDVSLLQDLEIWLHEQYLS